MLRVPLPIAIPIAAVMVVVMMVMFLVMPVRSQLLYDAVAVLLLQILLDRTVVSAKGRAMLRDVLLQLGKQSFLRNNILQRLHLRTDGQALVAILSTSRRRSHSLCADTTGLAV